MEARPDGDREVVPGSGPARSAKRSRLGRPPLVWMLLVAALVTAASASQIPPTLERALAAPAPAERALSILVDDFQPQPSTGAPAYRFNRLGGDRGVLGDSALEWGAGAVTATVAPGHTWGGVWMSLNHPAREALPVNFSALLPAPIRPAYQSRVIGLTARIARGTPGQRLRFELKDGAGIRWQDEVTLSGGRQELSFALPPLDAITQLAIVLDPAAAGAQVTLERVALTAVTPLADTATAAFVWSYAMLLNNWSPATGLARDKASDAGGAFDAIQATGGLAAATALAAQLGVVERADAARIVSRIGAALLVDTPRLHGLLPHFVTATPAGALAIAPGTEWSSVDTVIAAVGLLTAQRALGLDPSGAEELLRAIDWADLTAVDGQVAHGYSFGGERLPWAWDTFGGESWLVGLAYAAATGRVAPIARPLPPTANGAGFIDELAWLFVPPPSGGDTWGVSWASYRAEAAGRQLAYYPARHPDACVARLGLFGLSAAEVPSSPITGGLYQAFGVGGLSGANDGLGTLGAPAVTPHYAGLVASLRPDEALGMWDWLIDSGAFSPLGNVESLLFPPGAGCDSSGMVWNALKGSWNLSLQTLGWGRYLAERAGVAPALWQAIGASPLLRRGYALLAPREPVSRGNVRWLPSVVAARPAQPGAAWACERPDASAGGPEIVLARGAALPGPRAHHTSTPLTDGRILLAGGSRAPDEHLAEVAIFDAAAGTLTAAASLHSARHDHTATLLPDGRVLVVGGYALPRQWLTDAEVYDPAADVWTVLAPLYPHGTGHTATLLGDGRVLVVGGCIGSGVCTSRVEIFDPRTNTWAAAAPLGAERASHVAVLLRDGRVLVAGGMGALGAPSDGSALLYDPRRDSWAPAGPMGRPSYQAQAVRLRDGRVLVAGGVAWDVQPPLLVGASAEIYSPATDMWRPAAALAQARYAFVMAALPDGRVLAAGGAREWDNRWADSSFVRAVEVYDPRADRWRTAGELAVPRAYAAAARLPDGSLWVTGGQAGDAGATFWPTSVRIGACRARGRQSRAGP